MKFILDLWICIGWNYDQQRIKTNGFKPRYQKPNLFGPKFLKTNINPYLWTRGKPPKPFTCMFSMEESLGFQCLRQVRVLAFKVPWSSKIPSHNLSTTLLHGIMWSLFHIFSNPNCVLCSHCKCFKILFLLERAFFSMCRQNNLHQGKISLPFSIYSYGQQGVSKNKWFIMCVCLFFVLIWHMWKMKALICLPQTLH
jgi:hypothetical protein